MIPEDEEYIRSVQMGLMSPLSRSHGQSTPREPWVYSKTAQQAFRKINALRYRMLPYLYSTGWETCREGVPMMRAMLPMLSEVPRHIQDENFRDLELVVNITDTISQPYYDDGVEGSFHAELKNGVLEMTLQDIPAKTFRVYAHGELRQVIVNGETRQFCREGDVWLV